MIYVTSGHEKGIGLEVFIKSSLLLSQGELNNFLLYVKKSALIEHLNLCRIPFECFKNNVIIGSKKLSVKWVSEDMGQTLESLKMALNDIQESEILLTLPSSKDQFLENGQHYAGYTEYFRERYQAKNLCMTFEHRDTHVLLLTDHIPLKEVPTQITSELILNKVSTVIDNFEKYFSKLLTIKIAGINPHAGENGLLGLEESSMHAGIDKLKDKYSDLDFRGPLPGDTMHIESDRDTLLVYTYHDQGLGVFKSKHGLVGLNVTIGLPFLRMSVDHGTAFHLYGKNEAEYFGCLDMLKKALKINKRMILSHGTKKDSSC